MIDFEGLVLGPVMDVFAQPVTITPVVSQAGQPAYTAQGIFKADPDSIQMEDGSVVATTNYTLGLRLSDDTTPPVPDDQLTVAGLMFFVAQIHPDGQGGVVATLKRSS